jgi:NAD(P)-dependent dehydrogenase (short-subunit alcohol dehydrogenase family)
MKAQAAVVTGGSRGIGFAIAMALVKDGASVVVTGLKKPRLDDAVAELGRAGDPSRVHGVVADVRDRAAVDALVADAERRFGRLDVLVNNAGLGIFADVEKMTDEDWRRQIDTNLTGAFHCTRAAIPAMRRAGGGWIVNIASLAGRNYFAGGAAYCATKAGLVAFSEAVMQEVRHDGIRVTVVMPGSVSTEFNGRAVSAADAWKLTPDDVAQCVMDLLRHPARSLPSKVELRPSRPLK